MLLSMVGSLRFRGHATLRQSGVPTPRIRHAGSPWRAGAWQDESKNRLAKSIAKASHRRNCSKRLLIEWAGLR
eukprot:7376533-Alexandrium_andersonii.AAC.1